MTRKQRSIAHIRSAIFAGLSLMAVLTSASARAQTADGDKGILADLISRALSTPNSAVSIGAVEGALSSNVTVRDIVLSDRNGAYLRLDRVKLVWTRSALLRRRLEIDRLEIGRLELSRRPAPPPPNTKLSDQPILPELPVKVQIKAFTLEELVLGQTVAGTPARITANGELTLGPPSEGLNVRIDARRLDAEGRFDTTLAYVPATNTLTTALTAKEAAHGLFSHLANIPGEPPLDLQIGGTGTLDAFDARLAFRAGENIGADGLAKLQRVGTERRLVIDLASRVEGLLPQAVAPVFAGTTRLNGNIGFRDDGSLDISEFSLLSALARLDIAGRYNADRTLDFTIESMALPNDGAITKANETAIKTLAFKGTIKGDALSPKVDASLKIEDARLPYGHFDRLDATFGAAPNGKLGDADLRIDLDADGTLAGLALFDPGWAQAIGSRMVFKLRGATDADGATRFETLKLSAGSLSASFTGLVGAKKIAGDIILESANLANLSSLARTPLKGAAKARITLDGAPSRQEYSADIAAEAQSFSSGIPTLDRLAGNRLALTGLLTRDVSETVTIKDLRFDAAAVSARLAGSVDPETADLTSEIRLSDISKLDDRLSGKALANAMLSGPLQSLNARAKIEMTEATALKRPIPALSLDTEIRDLQGAPDIKMALHGTVDGKAANGEILATRKPDAWTIGRIDLALGTAFLRGNLTIQDDQLANGHIEFNAKNLDELSPLALRRLQGEANGRVDLSAEDGKQNASLALSGNRLLIEQNRLDKLALEAAIADAFGAPVINAKGSVDRAVVGGQTFDTIRLTSKGSTASSEIALSANAQGFDLATRATLIAKPLQLDIASFEAKRQGRKITLATPAQIRLADPVELNGVSFAIDGGRLSILGKIGSQLDLSIVAKSIPLSAARIVSPTLDMVGQVDGEAHVTGLASAPHGAWTLKATNIATPETRSAGLGVLVVSGKGQIEGDHTTADVTVNIPRGGTLNATGRLPFSASGAMDVQIRGQLDASIANAAIGAGGRSIGGALAIDVRATGSPTAPNVKGSATLANGRFSDALNGIDLTGIQARIVANGPSLTIERASAATKNGGTVSASGTVRLDGAAGFPAAIRLTAQRAQLISSSFITAIAGLDLSISGPLTQRPRVAGTVAIDTIEVSVAERLPTTLRPVDGIRHINAPPAVNRRLASAARSSQTADSRTVRGKGRKSRQRRPAPFDAVIAISVDAPGRIFVRGRGIDAELGGTLQVAGSMNTPSVNGGFDLRRGRLTIIGQRLDFTRGRVTFNGDIVPDLDFIAETRASDVTAYINVAGTASDPSFAFSSQPELPQDEVLSRILFSKASGSLSAFQAIQLAQAAAQFSGAGDDAFEGLRKSLGVDDLDVQFGANGPTVGITRAIGNNINVGLKTGTKPEESGVTVGVDITKRIKLQAEGTANGGASGGIAAEIEY